MKAAQEKLFSFIFSKSQLTVNCPDLSIIIFTMIKVLILLVFPFLIHAVTRHDLTVSTTQHLTSQPVHQGFLGGGGGSAGVGGIIFGFIFGPIFFACTCVCIWFNQKRAAIDSRRLKLADSICEEVDVNSQASAINQNGKLVHACGQTRTNVVLRDPLSGVEAPDLIKIVAQVEVKEWRRHERRNQERRESEQYYTKEWVSTHSASEGRYHNDPENWFMKSDTIYNEQVFLGGYTIDKETADKCEKTIPFEPRMEHGEKIVRTKGLNNRTYYISGEYIHFKKRAYQGSSPPYPGYNPPAPYQDYNQPPSYGPPQNQYGSPEGNYPPAYDEDDVGQLRVRYILCPTGDLSLVAKSDGYTFRDFPIAEYEGTTDETNNIPDSWACIVSNCYASLLKPIENIHLVEEKPMGMHEMFKKAISDSECLTRCLRFGCYLGLVCSMALFFSPISTILGFIPFVGGFIQGIVFFAIFLASLLICIPLYLLATSIAWLRFRPKVGLILVGIGLLIAAIIIVINVKTGAGKA